MTPEFVYRIMVVDDDADIRLMIEAALGEKYEVAHAHDGLDALEKIEKYEPDFIIMDIMMPLMSGFEACQAIRNNPRYQNIQVLFLSAYDSREQITQSYESGGNLFLAKPIDPERLLRNIDVFFEKRPLPPRSKSMTIKQIKLLEKVEKQPLPSTAPQAAQAPRRAMAPQAGPRHRHEALRRVEAPASMSEPSNPALTKFEQMGLRAGASLLPRILVVEDDEGLTDLIDMALSELFEVTVAHDGLDAVEKIVKYQPDIVLIDVMLPRMNGYQLCQSIRANRTFSRMPIVFITAKNTAKDREYAKRMGGDGFLGKPFEMEELVTLCRNIARKPTFRVRAKSLALTEIRAFERRETSQPPSEKKAPFDKRGRIY